MIDSDMEQTRYWMWATRKFNPRPPPLFNSPIPAVSWEEKVFAEDSAGILGGYTWPPRSYSCSFCRREFRSAQALGGHMNVHRRDRARLKQSSSPADHEVSEQSLDHVSSNLEYGKPNSNPSPSYGVIESFTNPIPVPQPRRAPELKLELGNWKVTEVGNKGKRNREDNDEIICSNKRPRPDAMLPSTVKPSNSVNLQVISQSNQVQILSPIPFEDLDLELRLGA